MFLLLASALAEPPTQAAVMASTEPVAIGTVAHDGKTYTLACRKAGAKADCRAMLGKKVVGSVQAGGACNSGKAPFMVEISGVEAVLRAPVPAGPGSFARAVCSSGIEVESCPLGWVRPCPAH